MNKFTIMCLSFLLSSPVLAGQWISDSYEHKGFTLPYQIYMPDTREKIPLIIHLHGSGEAGGDNQAQMYKGTNIGPQYFASTEIQRHQKAYILAPQTPAEMRWAHTDLGEYDFSKTPSTPSMTALLAMLDNVDEWFPLVDTSRIYMTGLSRGGQGVWNAALQRPAMFAAIVPIAGAGSPEYANLIDHLPTWAFHGNDDQITDVGYTQNMIDALIRSGASTKKVKYTEIEGGNHDSSWLTAFDGDDLYRWLIKHSG